MKISDIEKRVAEWNKTKEAAAAKLAELEAEMASVQDQKEASIDEGSTATFLSLKHREEELAAEILIQTRRVKKPNSIPLEDLKSAWNEYVAGCDKDRAKIAAAIDADIKKLSDDLRKYCMIRKEAKDKRGVIAQVAGMDSVSEAKARFPLAIWSLPEAAPVMGSEIVGLACKDATPKEKEDIISSLFD